MRLHLVERLWLLGRLERVAFESLVLFEGLGEVSTLPTASLVPERSFTVTCIALVELHNTAVFLSQVHISINYSQPVVLNYDLFAHVEFCFWLY